MSDQNERHQTNGKLDRAIKLCAKANKPAEQYLRQVALIARTMDDILDKDVEIPERDIHMSFFSLLTSLQNNEFYLRHLQELNALHVVIYNAWMDSNKWAKSDSKTKQLYSHVIRDFINEIAPYVAYCCGGYEHMRNVSLQIREMFMKEVGN